MKSLLPWICGLSFAFACIAVGVSTMHAYPADGNSATYDVVVTDGSHLIVTDNAKQQLYFYAIDPEAEIGSELHLRGHIDLKQVGQKSIKPTSVNPIKD